MTARGIERKREGREGEIETEGKRAGEGGGVGKGERDGGGRGRE